MPSFDRLPAAGLLRLFWALCLEGVVRVHDSRFVVFPSSR